MRLLQVEQLTPEIAAIARLVHVQSEQAANVGVAQSGSTLGDLRPLMQTRPAADEAPKHAIKRHPMLAGDVHAHVA